MPQISKPPMIPNAVMMGLIVGGVYLVLSLMIRDLCTPFVVMLALPAALNLKTPFDRLIFCAIPIGISLFLGIGAVLQLALLILVPSMVLGRLSLEQNQDGDYYPFDRLVGAFGFYALALTIVMLLFWQGLNGSDMIYKLLSDNLQSLPLESQPQAQSFQAVVRSLWPYMPGIYVLSFCLLFSWGIALAQSGGLQKKKPDFFSIPRPKLELSELYVPWIFWKLFAVLGVGTFVTYLLSATTVMIIFVNLSIAISSIFSLQGLAVVNSFAKKQQNPKMFLVVFYVIVVVIVNIPISLIILSLIGLLEPWLDLRSRIGSKTES